MNSNISNSENNIKKIKTKAASPNQIPVLDKEDSLSIIKSLSVDGVLVNLKIFSKIKNRCTKIWWRCSFSNRKS